MVVAMALFASGPAWAQILKPNAYPSPKDGLLLFEMLRPVDEPELFHSWRANLGYQYGRLDSKLASQPERRDLNSETAGLNFRIGARSFGSIDLTMSDRTFNFRALGLSTNADLNEAGIRVSGGTMLLPYLAVGGSLARNKLDGTYHFGAMPVDQASGALMSSSVFAALLYPAGDWKFSLTGAYTYDEASQSFADGFPREQKAWARTGTLVLAGLHPIAARLDGLASLTWSHVIDQRSFLAGRQQDEDWLRPSVGLLYKLTDQTAVSLVYSMYAMNEVYDYDNVSVGLSYKF